MELQLQQHRKFIKYSINETATDICPSFCDSSDTSSFCNPPCLTSCPSYCHNFLQSLIPSPSPVIFKYHIHHKSRKFLIITASALATTILVVICYVLFVKFYLRRRSSEPRIINQNHDDFLDEDHGPVVDHPIWYINTVGLQQSVIREIAVLKYRKGDDLVEGTECSVCLSEFQEDETLRLLPKCNHAFHISCIDTWLRSHTNCPLCRAPIVKINHAARATPPSSTSEPNNENSGTRESTQVCILTENDGRNDMESGIGAVERMNINERNDHDSDDEIQPIRRSVSLDSLSASNMMIQGPGNFNPEEITRNSNTQLAKERCLSVRTVPKKVGRSGSLMRPLQNVPVSLKRSLSYSGKFLL